MGENFSLMCGKGVYFVVEFFFFDYYCLEKERDGLKYMLMVCVLVGKMGCGFLELWRFLDDCDCVVDFLFKFWIFCVFDYN